MSVGRNLYWHEGLYLTPQHFQRHDESRDAKDFALLQATAPDIWGIVTLKMRPTALEAGILEVEECEFITREGTVIRGGMDVADGNALVSSRAVNDGLKPGDVLSVFLGISRFRRDSDNVALQDDLKQGDTQAKRYVLRDRDHADQYHPQSHDPVSVTFADYLVSIILETDSAARGLDAWEVIKVGELQARGSGVGVSGRYIPPCVHLSAAPVLKEAVRDLRDLILERTRDFSRVKSDAVVKGSAGRVQDVMGYLLLLSLNRCIGMVGQVLEDDRIHPYHVYQGLRMMLAELSTFSDDYDALGRSLKGADAHPVPPYDHANLTASVLPLIELLTRILHGLEVSSDDEIPLIHTGRSFDGSIPAEFFEGSQARFYLLVDTNLPENQLTEALVENGKLSSPDHINGLIERNLVGAPLELLPVAPVDLPARARHSRCLRVNKSNQYWDAVEAKGKVCFYAPALDPNDVILLVRSSR